MGRSNVVPASQESCAPPSQAEDGAAATLFASAASSPVRLPLHNKESLFSDDGEVGGTGPGGSSSTPLAHFCVNMAGYIKNCLSVIENEEVRKKAMQKIVFAMLKVID